jgi:hypothetical protein
MKERLTVVLWKWRNSGNWKKYTAGHVNAIAEMVDACCKVPCEFVLITDDGDGVHPGIRCLPLERIAAPLPAIRAPLRNAYRRVGIFSASAGPLLGRRLMQIDLDTVFLGDFTDLAMRDGPFVIWKSPSLGRMGYALNPSFILLQAGARADIHERYAADPEGVARAASASGFTSTDQAVISHLAGSDVATVDHRDGIVSFRDHLCRGAAAPAPGVKMVSFMDRFDPADPALQERCPWIAAHYPYRNDRMAA